MSEVTDTVEAYRAGSIDLTNLARHLGERGYSVSRRASSPDRPTDPDLLRDWLDRPWPVELGTWGEVVSCSDRGLITRDELMAITKAHEDWNKARLNG